MLFFKKASHLLFASFPDVLNEKYTTFCIKTIKKHTKHAGFVICVKENKQWNEVRQWRPIFSLLLRKKKIFNILLYKE